MWNFPDQELKLCSLQWKRGILTPGPSGKSKALGLLVDYCLSLGGQGAVLCIAGCLAAFLALPTSTSSVVTTKKCFQTLQNVPWVDVCVCE